MEIVKIFEWGYKQMHVVKLVLPFFFFKELHVPLDKICQLENFSYCWNKITAKNCLLALLNLTKLYFQRNSDMYPPLIILNAILSEKYAPFANWWFHPQCKTKLACFLWSGIKHSKLVCCGHYKTLFYVNQLY